MKTVNLAAAAAVALLALGLQAGGAQAACQRHIVNTSSCPWWFGAKPGPGDVYFGDGTLADCTQHGGPCKVNPGQTIDLKFTTSNGAANGFIWIVDQNKAYWAPHYDNAGINDKCPRIAHSGYTGAVSFNDPADGDLKAWACSWSNAPPSNVVLKKNPPKAMAPH